MERQRAGIRGRTVEAPNGRGRAKGALFARADGHPPRPPVSVRHRAGRSIVPWCPGQRLSREHGLRPSLGRRTSPRVHRRGTGRAARKAPMTSATSQCPHGSTGEWSRRGRDTAFRCCCGSTRSASTAASRQRGTASLGHWEGPEPLSAATVRPKLWGGQPETAAHARTQPHNTKSPP